MTPEISVVVPVYRNAATLDALHARLRATLDAIGNSYELWFIDDASPDDSHAVLRRLASDRVRVIALDRNVGQNRAVMHGLTHARGDVVVVMDADLQDPPEAIPRLLSALHGRTAAVFAGRRGAYEGRARRATSSGLKWLLWLLSRGRLPRDAVLFVAMRRNLLDAVVKFDVADPYVVALIGRTGFPLASIPVERAQRADGHSTYTGRMRLRVAWRALGSSVGPLRGPTS